MSSRDDRQEHADALIARLDAAFGDEAPPARGDLIQSPERERDRPEADEYGDAIAGRRWQDLEDKWLYRHWAGFCYLTPPAWRAYIPAVLRMALRQIPRRNPDKDDTPPMVHTATYELAPSAWAIEYEGEDERHEARVAALTDEQFDVVCAFLDLVHRTWLPYEAADAMRWGWSQRETPHHAAVRAHDARLSAYEWPEHADPIVAALVAQIRAAFADRPYPGDDELCGDDGGDEPPELALSYRGRDWRTIHPDFLAAHSDGRFFLSDSAYCYYLPAWLIHALHEGAQGPLWGLTGVTEKDGLWAERHDDLGPEESEAVVAWLRHYAVKDHDERGGIQRALEEYWLPRLESD